MAINLLNVQPNQVSKDLSGYSIYLYGPAGVGKTTFCAKVEGSLLLAFEIGYKAIPGIMAQPVSSWSEMKQIVRELKKPEIKAKFKVICIDTVDLASIACEKYVCNQLGIENIGDGGWSTNGWAKVKREWEQTFKDITMAGYTLIFISHEKDKTFKRKDGTEYNQIVASCSNAYNEIVKNFVDIMAYVDINQGKRYMVLRSEDNSIDCKCRFSEAKPMIEFSYDSLVNEIIAAIEKEAAKTNGQYLTNDKIEIPQAVEYNFEELISEFQMLAKTLMEKDAENQRKITSIIERYLGRGKKVAECTEQQAEIISLIIDELKML